MESPSREQRVNEAIAVYLAEVDAGRVPERQAFLGRYPALASELAAFLDDRERFARGAAPLGMVPYFGDYEFRRPLLALRTAGNHRHPCWGCGLACPRAGAWGLCAALPCRYRPGNKQSGRFSSPGAHPDHFFRLRLLSRAVGADQTNAFLPLP